jgi:hypothetical protein
MSPIARTLTASRDAIVAHTTTQDPVFAPIAAGRRQ